MAEQQGYFYELLGMTDEELEVKRRGLLDRKVRRQLASAYDNAQEQVVHQRGLIEDELKSLRHKNSDGLDVNAIVGWQKRIRELEQGGQEIADLFQRLFGEPIPTLG